MLEILRKNAHAPALLVDTQTDVNVLTRKINSATLTHGKPPFGECFVCEKNHYNRNRETCLSFSIIRSEERSKLALSGAKGRISLFQNPQEILRFAQNDVC